MSGYLQRLADRGAVAGLPPVAAGAAPAAPVNSPLASFDQRLSMQAFAQNYTILGAAHDVPDAAEAEAAPAAHAPLQSSGITLARPGPDQTASVRTGEARPADHAGNAEMPDRIESVLRIVEVPSQDAAPAPTLILRRPEHMASTTAIDRPAAPEHLASAAMMPGVTRNVQPVVAPRLAPDVSGQQHATVPLVAKVPASTERQTPSEAETAPRPEVAREPRSPVQTDKVLSHPRHVPATPHPSVAPSPVARPQLVAAPAPTYPDATQLKRMVEQAVSREFARRYTAERPAADAKPSREPNVVKSQAPPPRPLTAREASVIGDIEPSSRPLLLFGMRRR